MSNIEWTDVTWNVLAGCSPVSEGCRNCYAAREAIRLAGNPNEKIAAKYTGTAEMRGAGKARRPVFTGTITVTPDVLSKPFSWRTPRRVFVNSMSDLFHESVQSWVVAHHFAVMAATPQHTYQVLTKRPAYMAELLRDPHFWAIVWSVGMEHWWNTDALAFIGQIGPDDPLPNVWLGTSVENQEAADERIPHLLRTPAAVRFLSCEPLLGPVDLTEVELPEEYRISISTRAHINCLTRHDDEHFFNDHEAIDWVIVGGESGPGARECDAAWIRSIVRQCREAGTPVFVKQLGAMPLDTCVDCDGRGPRMYGERRCQTCFETGRMVLRLRDRKGGDPSEWPQDLRVREFPNATAGV